jgi:putative tryptophan/tyrosine transport system substrate-binding protein
LKRLGYSEGENLIVDRYSAEGLRDRYGDLAREAVGSHPDVIVSIGSPLTGEFKVATSTIPIVALPCSWRPYPRSPVSSLSRRQQPGKALGAEASKKLREAWGFP